MNHSHLPLFDAITNNKTTISASDIGASSYPDLSDGQLLAAAKQKIEELCSKFDIKTPSVSLDLTGRVAGKACIRDNQIRLNLILFKENVDYFINQTIPHELCHLWHYQLGFKDSPHGHKWQRLMLRMGVTPTRTHSLDVSRSVTRRSRHFNYRCACSNHLVSTRLHNKILKGAKYLCKKCDQVLSIVSTQ
jgi:SprT protein